MEGAYLWLELEELIIGLWSGEKAKHTQTKLVLGTLLGLASNPKLVTIHL